MLLFRRKHTRTTDHHNDHGSSSAETSSALEDDNPESSKSLLISTQSTSSSSPSHKKSHRQVVSSKLPATDDIPPPLPSRKPFSKSLKATTTTSNAPVLISSSQIQSTTNDETFLPNSRRLSNKEISTSLVNLMGTATDSVPVNNNTNTTQIPSHDSHRISSTPAASVDRLGIFGSSTNVDTSGMIESSSQRTIVSKNNFSGYSLSNASTKSVNEYTWCYEITPTIQTETTTTSVDECLPQLEVDDKPLIYRQQFESTEHFNWYGISDSQGPVIISYKYSNDPAKQRYVMAIVRTRQRTSIESLFDLPPVSSSIDILRRICDQCGITDMEYFDPVLCDGAHDLLIKYDESHVSTKHKFGIIYQRENQLSEEDIFSNETHSPAMEKFLDLIGNHVKLKDFQGFRGGLDVKSDHTGTESIYEQFNNHEIMFHVSTLLPYSKIERQQLERKRHIGNDIVAIIFQENETTFIPECIASQFLHVYLVITPLDHNGTNYKVSVIHRDSVPSFGPFIKNSNIFHYDNLFKQWLLTKLINAELASCRASTFQKYQERTKINLFENLYRTLHDNNRPLMNFIFHHSQYKHECDIEQQKEDVQIFSSTKIYDRHTDNSLLGSVRRRFISSKSRTQHTTTPPPPPSSVAQPQSPAAIIISTASSNNINDTKSKTRSMTMDLKRSASKETMITNGKMTSIFSLSKNQNPRLEKTHTNRSLLDVGNSDSTLNPHTNSKYLSPRTCPSTPFDGFNSNEDYLLATTFDFNKLSTDNNDHDNHHQLPLDNLHASSKDDLIKYVMTLQQQHSLKLAQLDENHSKTIKQLEMQLFQQQQQQNTTEDENL